MTDRRAEIPKDFTLREQALVVHQTARMREDFIARKRGANKMSDEDMNLQTYTVAVLDAAAQTLKALHAERKGIEVVRKEPEPIQIVDDQVEEIPPEGQKLVHPETMIREEGDDGF